MTELKTLKDIEGLKGLPEEAPVGTIHNKETRDAYDDGYSTGWILGVHAAKEESREEAIKWIKELEKTKQIWHENLEKHRLLDGWLKREVMVEYDKTHEYLEGWIVCQDGGTEDLIIYWIKHFFGITEEDLKW